MIAKSQLNLEMGIVDEFGPFIGKVVGIITDSNHRRPLFGKLTAISKDFLSIQKRNGRIIMISKRRVLEIWETLDQPQIAEIDK